MRIAATYSFNRGKEVVSDLYPTLLSEIKDVIAGVDAQKHKKKRSKEKTMRGTILYSPISLNKAFKKQFSKRHWESLRIKCDYRSDVYEPDYAPALLNKGAFREMDFIKGKLGVEVQFGKYAFMVYNVSAKMTIFHNLGFVDAGVEIVPVKAFASEMSSGVSYFEQFVWDLDNRGVSNIDIPVLILGVDD